MKKIHLIQFLPFFPPHVGGVEKVGEEIFTKWTHGESFILSGNKCQQGNVYKKKVDNNTIYFFPCIEIVDNFIFPSLWTIQFWKVWKEFNKEIKNVKGEKRVLTHTRFFLSSLMGGLFARKNEYKWVHLEHGSAYVQSGNKMVDIISYIYDRILGKWIFKKADVTLAISQASKKFIRKEFGVKDVEVWYRGIEFPEKNLKYIGKLHNKFPNKIIIGYIGRLYKWKNIETLCLAYLSLSKKIQKNSQIVIIGGGEEEKILRKRFEKKGIYFTGILDFDESFTMQGDFDIHVHPSSPGGGLATTILQAMQLGSIIVATPNEGAKEILFNNKNAFLLKNDSIEEILRGINLAVKSLKKKDRFLKENIKILQEKFDITKNIKKLYNFVK